MRWPVAGLISSITLVCSARVRGHHVTWPMTILPSRVAGPVAAKALQWSSTESRLAPAYAGLSKLSPSRPVAVVETALRQLAQFHGDVRHHDVHEVDAAVEPLRSGVGCALGDAAHLLHDFAIEAAEKQRVGGGAILRPTVPWNLDRRRSAPGIRESLAPSGGRAGSRVRTECLRCGGRSNRRTDSDRRGRTSGRPRVAGHASAEDASSRLTPSNHALPRMEPSLPAVSRIASCARLATNFKESRVHG